MRSVKEVKQSHPEAQVAHRTGRCRNIGNRDGRRDGQRQEISDLLTPNVSNLPEFPIAALRNNQKHSALTRIYCLTVLEVRNLQWVYRDTFLQETLEDSLFACLFQLLMVVN